MHNDRHDVTAQFPQFRVVSSQNFTEYRFYNCSSKDGKSNVWILADACWIALLSYVVNTSGTRIILAAVCLFVLYGYRRCTAVIYESVIALPQCGIQLETHRGLSNYPLFIQRRFIPGGYVRDVFINEALRRWNVRYYLAVLINRPDGSYELAVAFESLLPRLPVLLDVYTDIRKKMDIE